MKNGAKSIIVLTVICLVIAGLLAAVNHVTAPIIQKAEEEATNRACGEVMSGAASFEKLSTDIASLPDSVKEIYKETSGKGYVFKISGKGYDKGLVVVCGIDASGRITGTSILSSNETPSVGGRCNTPEFLDQFTGKGSDLSEISGISGATLTSNGFKNAVADAFKAFEAVTGEMGGTK